MGRGSMRLSLVVLSRNVRFVWEVCVRRVLFAKVEDCRLRSEQKVSSVTWVL